MPLVEQELPTLPEHLSSPPVDRCLSFCTFSFCHCVVCSSIYGFWLPIWYIQTLLYSIVFYSRVIFLLTCCHQSRLIVYDQTLGLFLSLTDSFLIYIALILPCKIMLKLLPWLFITCISYLDLKHKFQNTYTISAYHH